MESLTNIPSENRVYESRYANLILHWYESSSYFPNYIEENFRYSIIDIEVRINADAHIKKNFKLRYLHLKMLIDGLHDSIAHFERHREQNTLKNRVKNYFKRLLK
jgi:hypothetical protein